jgi:hypothetical protein
MHRFACCCAAAVSLLVSAAVLRAEEPAREQSAAPRLFKTTRLNETFLCEGAAIGDFNKDGKMDIVSGPYWYEGPDFTKKHLIYPLPEKPFEGAHGYSDNFLTYVYDFNGDGWPDVLVIGFPGKEAFWYENPKGEDKLWTRHLAHKSVDNESPIFGDLLGDGKPVIICCSGGYIGYIQPDYARIDEPWTFHPVSPAPADPKKPKYQRFTHGIGFGDINGDGKADILEAAGWWEQPKTIEGDHEWTFHKANFGQGGAQMLVYDVNGDGLPDVITSLQALGYGLAWFEQKRDDKGEISFVQHLIIGNKFSDSPYGTKFTEMHALALADMDGDGLMDVVTGKRFWAHGPTGDPEGQAPAVLYWFRLVRHADHTAEFVPYKLDDNSGVGTQVTVGDVNGDGMPDIIVGNKKGTFVSINQIKQFKPEQIEAMHDVPSANPEPAGK